MTDGIRQKSSEIEIKDKFLMWNVPIYFDLKR